MLSEGLRVKTRDDQQGVVVEPSFDMLGWWDVLLDKDKKPLQYAPDELTVIDAQPEPESDLPTQASVAIFSNQLVRLHDGRMGFTQKNRVGDVWDVYVCESQKVERHADWRLTPLQVAEPPASAPEPQAPTPCTALVPMGQVMTLKEAVYKPREERYTTAYLMLAVLYAGKWMDTWLLLGGAMKEVRRLRGAKTGQKITPANTTEIVIDKPIKQADDLFRRAVTSGKFTSNELSRLGDATAILNLAKSKLESVS